MGTHCQLDDPDSRMWLTLLLSSVTAADCPDGPDEAVDGVPVDHLENLDEFRRTIASFTDLRRREPALAAAAGLTLTRSEVDAAETIVGLLAATPGHQTVRQPVSADQVHGCGHGTDRSREKHARVPARGLGRQTHRGGGPCCCP
ncbi:hypothetical protein [Alloactinosynnema sp. L-07]|uniref:hypothetical protein n=1 Tax=Alloactinosynnema sp. L-07 TaxID=1653480 RepID=UPI00065EF029|nr:hypothetical protein [Alloactinosynnema sp. L-07]CRK55103.1 hypothetical protein [Alloactinosynnema sp. L-07]